MSRVVVRSPGARRDLANIAVGFDEVNETLADRFLDSVAEGLDQLARMPGIGAKVEGLSADLAGLRCSQVPNFKNYLIFYRYDDEEVEVIRVLHGARDIESILGEFEG